MALLGVIQSVSIRDEGYAEDEERRTIWFVQKRVRNFTLSKLRKRDFKVATVLIKEGYKISDPEQFDLDLKRLLGKEKDRSIH